MKIIFTVQRVSEEPLELLITMFSMIIVYGIVVALDVKSSFSYTLSRAPIYSIVSNPWTIGNIYTRLFIILLSLRRFRVDLISSYQQYCV